MDRFGEAPPQKKIEFKSQIFDCGASFEEVVNFCVSRHRYDCERAKPRDDVDYLLISY